MTFTAHIVVGSAVGVATGNPVAGFFAGWITHLLMDAIPHVDTTSDVQDESLILKDKRILARVAADVSVGTIIFILIIWRLGYSASLFWGAFGCIWPDLTDNVPLWSPFLKKYFPFNYFSKLHSTIHAPELTNNLWLGVLTQIVIVGLSLGYIVLK